MTNKGPPFSPFFGTYGALRNLHKLLKAGGTLPPLRVFRNTYPRKTDAWQWKISTMNEDVSSKMVTFRCHLRFQEATFENHRENQLENPRLQKTSTHLDVFDEEMQPLASPEPQDVFFFVETDCHERFNKNTLHTLENSHFETSKLSRGLVQIIFRISIGWILGEPFF